MPSVWPRGGRVPRKSRPRGPPRPPRVPRGWWRGCTRGSASSPVVGAGSGGRREQLRHRPVGRTRPPPALFPWLRSVLVARDELSPSHPAQGWWQSETGAEALGAVLLTVTAARGFNRPPRTAPGSSGLPPPSHGSAPAHKALLLLSPAPVSPHRAGGTGTGVTGGAVPGYLSWTCQDPGFAAAVLPSQCLPRNQGKSDKFRHVGSKPRVSVISRAAPSRPVPVRSRLVAPL